MNIDKMVEIEILNSQYSPLLTSKQREIIAMYYEEDYSLDNYGFVHHDNDFCTVKRQATG